MSISEKKAPIKLSKEIRSQIYFYARSANAMTFLDIKICHNHGFEKSFLLALLQDNYNFYGIQNQLINVDNKLMCKLDVINFGSNLIIWKQCYYMVLLKYLLKYEFIEVVGNIKDREILYIIK